MLQGRSPGEVDDDTRVILMMYRCSLAAFGRLWRKQLYEQCEPR